MKAVRSTVTVIAILVSALAARALAGQAAPEKKANADRWEEAVRCWSNSSSKEVMENYRRIRAELAWEQAWNEWKQFARAEQPNPKD